MALTGISGGFQLEHATALDYFRAIAAGMPPGGINAAYRSDADQAALFRENYTANYFASAKFDRRRWNGVYYWRRTGYTVSVAVPGTSNHGTGTALDLAAPQQTWMRANGATFGFVNPAWAKNSSTFEPWHWEHSGVTPTYIGDDMTAEEIQDALRVVLETDRGQNATVKSVWSLATVNRNGVAVPAIQELADAKTNAIQANAKADAILAALAKIPGFDTKALAADIAKAMPAPVDSSDSIAAKVIAWLKRP